MRVEQIYEKCLSQASYYIEHNGVVAVIDTLRDTARYQSLAAENNAKIQYIFETHFHADFVSGHMELERKTGASIIFGPGAVTGFGCHVGTDGEVFNLNGATLTLLHTPGHTLESACILLTDEAGTDKAVFTGDTLFLGDVGRPDLAQDMNEGITTQDLAGMLYDSLRKKILPLADTVIVFPGHGAGSACGKNMSKDTDGDLGTQRNNNYALNEQLSKKEFIDRLCDELSPAPAYFPMNVNLNSRGYEPFNEVRNRVEAMTPYKFKQRMHVPGTIVIDVREAEEFAKGHVSGSINIGLNGAFAPWVGQLIPSSQVEILLIVEQEHLEEAITRLSRIGYHQCGGFLDGGMQSWKDSGFSVGIVEQIDATEFAGQLKKGYVGFMLDVRGITEAKNAQLLGSYNLPLSSAMDLSWLNGKEKTYVLCAGGYRSMIFISIAMAEGFSGMINVKGGFGEFNKALQMKPTSR